MPRYEYEPERFGFGVKFKTGDKVMLKMREVNKFMAAELAPAQGKICTVTGNDETLSQCIHVDFFGDLRIHQDYFRLVKL